MRDAQKFLAQDSNFAIDGGNVFSMFRTAKKVTDLEELYVLYFFLNFFIIK